MDYVVVSLSILTGDDTNMVYSGHVPKELVHKIGVMIEDAEMEYHREQMRLNRIDHGSNER